MQVTLDTVKQDILYIFGCLWYNDLAIKEGLFMTIGEKIQFYRKRNGLSQEELGQKLLVSRQTVSLWEMDKTLPTIDNLIRLKEIFAISIDDILSESEITEEKRSEPRESYVFKYEKSDLQELFKKARLPLIKRHSVLVNAIT